jgi:hypothetical protein
MAFAGHVHADGEIAAIAVCLLSFAAPLLKGPFAGLVSSCSDMAKVGASTQDATRPASHTPIPNPWEKLPRHHDSGATPSTNRPSPLLSLPSPIACRLDAPLSLVCRTPSVDQV